MKYKLIGLFNILLGLLQMSYPVITYLFVMPKLYEMYYELELNYTPSYILKFGFAFIFVYGLANVIVGILLFGNSNKRDSYLVYGVVLNILNFIFGGLGTGLIFIALIAPIYSIGAY